MSKVSRIAFILAVAALVSCVDENGGGNGITPEDPTEENTSNLTTVQLASFAGDASRVSYPVTRAEGDETDAEGEVAGDAEIKPGTLRLIASIDNPSTKDGFNFSKEENGRYMSATSVYYDEGSETYYVTYHIQGNNYNTTLDTSTAGAIQSFKIDENGEVELGTGFRAPKPEEEDFDFNHIYFDEADKRILAVGHNVKGGNQDNTNAIVGIFNPTAGTYTYSTVKTGEKAYDDDGKSLGYKDAGDVNYVIRGGEFNNSGWKFYFVATRKGMAVLRSEPEYLFKPVLNEDGTSYFVPTKGSAKSISGRGTSSSVNLLYLSEDTSEKPEAYATSSEAKIAHFMINKVPADYTFGELLIYGKNGHTPFNPQIDIIEDIAEGDGQTVLPAISPIDGKNTICSMQNMGGLECYAALGVSGLYYNNEKGEGVLTFGNRPVNSVCADENNDDEKTQVEDGTYGHDGFIYVANGSKLTILHRLTREEVVSWNMPSKDADGNDIASSANFIAVSKGPKGENGFCERTIAVAFGQAGVKIFKFMPNYRVWK